MKRYHYWVLSILSIGLIGSSFLLVPGRQELALMRLRDKDYEAARRLYARQSISEDLPVSVVVPLTELYLQNADVNSAVEVVERFVRRNPSNVSARRRLGQLYQFAQRPKDYLANLEQICRIEGTEKDLRELSDALNFEGEYTRQIQVLRSLIARRPRDARNYLDLAYLQASQRLLKDSAETMRHLERVLPGSLDDQAVEFLVSLLLDTGQADEAYRRAASWGSKHREPAGIGRFAGLLHYKNQPALALRFLEPHEKLIRKEPALLAQLIELLRANGQSDRAYTRLSELEKSGRLPEMTAGPFVELCLDRREFERAISFASTRSLDLLPDWSLERLGESARTSGRRDFLRRILAGAHPGFLEARPVVAARWAFETRNQALLRYWIDAAEAREDLTLNQKLDLVHLYFDLGRREPARVLLEEIARTDILPGSSILDLARLHQEAGSAAGALPLFESLRARNPSGEAESAWALVSTAAGQAGPVLAWLGSHKSQSVPDGILVDLYFMAEDQRKSDLAQAVAEKLYVRRKDRKAQFLLGRALAANGKALQALPYLRPLLPGLEEEASAYENALNAAAETDLASREELRRFLAQRFTQPGLAGSEREDLVWKLLSMRDYNTVLPALAQLARRPGGSWVSVYVETMAAAGRGKDLAPFLHEQLKQPRLPESSREELLYVLIEHAGEAAALPYLRSLAWSSAGKWNDAYEGTLVKLNRRTELHAWWKARLAEDDPSAAERRGIGYRALDAGQKDIAVAAFRSLAASAPPDSPDVSQLLFLWGPRPSRDSLDWLDRRASASTDAELAAWMKHLTHAGASSRAVAAARYRLPRAGHGGPVLDEYLDALVTTGDLTELDRILKREIAATTGVERLRRLARMAYDSGRTATARDAFLRILTSSGDDREALKRLGELAFFESNYTEANAYLGRYLAGSTADFEVNYYYSELLLRERKPRQARVCQERSLQQLRSAASRSSTARAIEVKLLFRLGREKEGQTLCRRLVQESPEDDDLRADLAAALLDSGLTHEAGLMLSRK